MRRSTANERIDLRTPSQTKYYLELAAFLGGFGSLTSFMLSAAEEQAKSIFSGIEHEKKILSERDKELLLTMLAEPPEPNANLKNVLNMLNKIYTKQGEQLIQEVPDHLMKSK